MIATMLLLTALREIGEAFCEIIADSFTDHPRLGPCIIVLVGGSIVAGLAGRMA